MPGKMFAIRHHRFILQALHVHVRLLGHCLAEATPPMFNMEKATVNETTRIPSHTLLQLCLSILSSFPLHEFLVENKADCLLRTAALSGVEN